MPAELSHTRLRAVIWLLKLTYSYFFNESDTTPGYYNPARYGNNNRIGQSFEARFAFKKYQFAIVGQYVDAGTINFDLNQQRLNIGAHRPGDGLCYVLAAWRF